MKIAWIKFLALAAVIAALVLLLKAMGLDVMRLTPEQIRAFVRPFGPWAPLGYLAVYSQPLVPLPASIMMMAAGLVFGVWQGLAMALVGATARACSQFAVARLMGRDAVAGFLKGRAQRLEQQIAAKGFVTVVLVRLIPNFPSDIQNYGLGCSSVRFWPYALGTWVGLMPWTAAFVYLGSVLTDLRRIVLVLALLVAVSVAMIVLRSRPPSATS